MVYIVIGMFVLILVLFTLAAYFAGRADAVFIVKCNMILRHGAAKIVGCCSRCKLPLLQKEIRLGAYGGYYCAHCEQIINTRRNDA